tara:strand:- start:541 stop:1347 length:807 start_codon:yes stop_codon:yes gene_type:complete
MDQFYTNRDTAIKCYKKLCQYVNIDDYDILLEPSAGTGAFYKLLDKQKRVGLDLEPKYDGIIKMDFFDFIPKDNCKYISIGNPPFGRVSSLAVKFFNKCAKFSDCIAFIIPRTFKRVSLQNKLNLNFHLIYNEDLPLKPCCFTPKMNAKCCFQIWKKMEIPRELIIYDKTHPDFNFMKHGPKDKKNQPTPPKNPNFAIKAYGGSVGTIQDKNFSELRPKSWHWIKSNIDMDELIKRFNQLDFSIAKDTVRQDSIGQKELIHLYKLKFN